MRTHLVGLGLAVGLSTAAAEAATCPANPYTLTNGTSADASQVMADFNNLLNCANSSLAPVANPKFTGFVGVGTAAPANPLDITAAGIPVHLKSSGPDDVISFENVASGGRAFNVGSTGSASGAGNGFSIYDISSGGGARFLINSVGNVGIATTAPTLTLTVNGTAGGTSAYQVVSDARLKKNVQPLANGLALVQRLSPVRYDWRNPGERGVGKSLNLAVGEKQIGFIAQDVEKVIPEAVSKPRNPSDPYSLKEDNLIPLLVAAIKEQQAQIDELRADLAALKH